MSRGSDLHGAPEPQHVPRRRPGPSGGARDVNRRQRTLDLCAAALELFLRRGIEDVTIDDIVRAARVAKGSFYRYFRDKAELVEALFAPMAERVAAAFRACEEALRKAGTRDDLFAAYRQLAQHLGAAIMLDPRIARLYLQECRAPAAGGRACVRAIADRIAAKSIELTRMAHEQKLLRPIDPRVSALAVVGAVERLLFGVLSGEDVGDAFGIPNALISMVLDGLRPDQRP